jgi:hypothetical protein
MTNFLDIIHPLSELKHIVSETGICLHHQAKNTPTLLGTIDRASLYLWRTEVVRSKCLK